MCIESPDKSTINNPAINNDSQIKDQKSTIIVIRTALLVLVLVVATVAADEPTRTVALTFDDLPAADSLPRASEASRGGREPSAVAATNLAILQALDRHRAPATGFVIGERVEMLPNGRELLQQWIERGHDLGNHTFSHGDVNTQSVQTFTNEVARTEAIIRPLLPSPRTLPLYLRFPFNHTGDSADKHDAIAAWLGQRGYEVAVCTIDNSDYIFASAYSRTIASGGAEAAILRTEYLAHTAKIIDYYTGLHRMVFGRETTHVMLLHANRLNADVLDRLLELFEERQFRFVSLRDAQADPAFKTADTWRTKAGPMWGYRWARSLGVRVNGALEPEPAGWVKSAGGR
jgi:peptidoglycan/xylan/chitin deacetylase (PgdA/CDA1 family)